LSYSLILSDLFYLFVPCTAGWGGPGGYVYQKAYLAKELVLILII
jgi:hypothetical protein